MEGGAGDDLLVGGPNDDVYRFVGVGLGRDTVDEAPAEGDDALDFSEFRASVDVRLWDEKPQAYDTKDDASELTLVDRSGLERVIGSAFDDTIEGNSRENTLEGGSGNDTLDGRDGFDTYVYAGENLGADLLLDEESGGNRLDLRGLTQGVALNLRSAERQDLNRHAALQMKSPAAFTSILGTDFDDVLIGNEGANQFEGRSGNDTLRGEQGNDQLRGGDGDDQIEAGDGYNLLDGGSGADRLAGNAETDVVVGGSEADTFNGHPWNDKPVVVNDVYEAAEDTALVIPPSKGLLANDWEQDGRGYSITIVSKPRGVVVIDDAGGFTYTPPSNFSGADEFVYRLTDEAGAEAEGKVRIDVRADNDAPLALDFPESQSVPAGEWSPLALGQIQDDAPSHAELVVVLKAERGLLRATGGARLGSGRVTGNDSHELSLRGTVADLNGLLAQESGVEYRIEGDASHDRLTVVVHDLGSDSSENRTTEVALALSISSERSRDLSRDEFDDARANEWTTRAGSAEIAGGRVRLTGADESWLSTPLSVDPRTSVGQVALRVSAEVDLTADSAVEAAGLAIGYDDVALVAALHRTFNGVQLVLWTRDFKSGEATRLAESIWIADVPRRGRVELQLLGGGVSATLDGIRWVEASWKSPTPDTVGLWALRSNGREGGDGKEGHAPLSTGRDDSTDQSVAAASGAEFDDFVAINLGEPGSSAPREVATTLPYHEEFSGSGPAGGWTSESMFFADGVARFGDNSYSQMRREASHYNVAVQGFVSVVRNAAPMDDNPLPLRAGLIVRHNGQNYNQKMYWAGLVRERDGDYVASIDRVERPTSGGDWTITNLAKLDVPQGQGLLRFEAVGAHLRLFIDGELTVSVDHAEFPDSKFVGMLGYRPGGTVDSFSAWAMDSSGYLSASLGDVVTGDFNGDGVVDQVGHFDGEGSGADQDTWMILAGPLGGEKSYPYLRYVGAWPANLGANIMAGDFNGDGRDDVLGRSGTDWWLLRSDGDRFLPPQGIGSIPMQGGDFRWTERVTAGDINGDGRDEILGYNKFASPPRWDANFFNGNRWDTIPLGGWTVNPPTGFTPIVGDFDGDGRDDIAVQDVNQDWRLLTSIGTALVETAFVYDEQARSGLRALDYDGDGADEILAVGGSTLVSVDFVSGRSFGAALGGVAYAVGDVNQDGRGDLLERRSNGEWVAHSWLGANPSYGARTIPTTFPIERWSWGTYAGYFADVDGPIAAATAAFANVRNTIEYQLYPGYLKGPEATRQTKAGNHWDQAALLKQDLEKLGFVVKYAWGTFTPSEEDAINWIGASDKNSAVHMLRLASLLPNQGSNLQLTGIRHAWTTVELPAVEAGGAFLAARPLDPSWKLKLRRSDYLEALSDVPYDDGSWSTNTVRNRYLLPTTTAQYDERSQLLPYEYYEDELQAWLQNNTSSADRRSLADVPFDGPIIAEFVATLPDGVPYTPGSVSTAATVPDGFRQQIKVGMDYRSAPSTWSPLWSADQTILTADEGLATYYVEYANGTTQLRKAGVASPLQVGGAISSSSEVRLVIKHFDVDEQTAGSNAPAETRLDGQGGRPGGEYVRKAGEYLTIGIQALQHSSESLRTARDVADGIAQQLWQQGSPASGPTAGQIAALMGLAGSQFFFDLTEAADAISGLLHRQIVWQGVGTGIVSSRGATASPAARYAFDKHVQVPVVPQAMSIDVKGIHVVGTTKAGATPTQYADRESVEMFADTLSALEHNVLQELFNVDAISTVKGLQRSRAFGGASAVAAWPATPPMMPQDYLDQLQISAELKLAVADWFPNGGRILAGVHELAVGQDDWTGGVFLAERLSPSLDITHTIEGNFKGGYAGFFSEPVTRIDSLFQQSIYGDPVNVANGAVYRDETDLSLPNIGVPLEFSRHYESLNSYDPMEGSSGLDIGLGQGWTHSYSDFLTLGANSEVTWTNSQGQKHTFTRPGSVYVNPPSLFGTFERVTENQANYQQEDGLRRYFEKNGNTPANLGPVLVRIVDRFGRGVSVNYINGKIVSVSDVADASRRINFTYYPSSDPDAPDHLQQIQEFGSGGRAWTYKYVKLTPPASSPRQYLASVAQPDDPSRHNDRFAAQPLVQYAYYDSGRIHGLLKRIVEPNGGTHDYTYYVNRRSFEVTDAEGHTTYGAYNLYTQATTFYNERGFAETYEYDANGLLVRHTYPDRSRDRFAWSGFRMTSWTDAFGNRENYTYEGATNKLDSSEDRFGLVTTYDWHDTYWALPKEETRPGGRKTTYFYEGGSAAPLDYVQVVADGGAAETLTTDYVIASHGLLDKLYTPRGVPSGVAGSEATAAYRTSFGYNAAGLPYDERRGTTANPVATTYTYDVFGGSAALTRGFLLTTTDPTGLITTNTYDAIGRLKDTSLPNPDGSGPLNPPKTTFVYDAWGQLYKQADLMNPASNADFDVKHDYDRKGRRIRTTYADGTFVSLVYDGVGNVVAETDELGRATRHFYDARNRRVQTIFADGSTVLMLYDADGQLVVSQDERGNQSTRQYGRDGQLTKETSAAPKPLPAPGGPDPAALAPLVTTYTYEAATQRLQRVTRPDGGYTVFTYDKADRVYREDLYNNGALELVTFHRFDRDGNEEQTRRYDVKGVSVPADWDAFGAANPSRYRRIRTTFDNFNRPEDVFETWEDSGANVERRSITDYDAAGRVTLTKTPRGVAGSYQTDYLYDAAGRLQKVQPPADGNSYSGRPETVNVYDQVGNVEQVKVLRAAGNYDIQFTRRDDRYRAVFVSEAYGELGAITQVLFDAAGQAVATIDPLNRTTYQRYDARGRVVAVYGADPDGSGSQRPPVTRFTYDAAGNLTAEKDALNRETLYEYDELNRRTKTRLPDPDLDPAPGGSNGPLPALETWNYYDAEGHLDRVLTVKNAGTPAAKPGGATDYDYDDRGHVTVETLPDPDGGGATSLQQPRTIYAFNGFGEVVSKTAASVSGSQVTTYDTTTYSYYRTGWLKETLGDIPQAGETRPLETRFYDADGNVEVVRTRIRFDGANEINRDLRTLHDALGQVHHREESLGGQFGSNANPVTLYFFDLVGNQLTQRLYTSSGGANELRSYTYDELGRRTGALFPDPDGPSDNSNRPYLGYLVGAGEELISPTEYYDYDLAGQLFSVTDASGNATEFVYDALGRKTSETNYQGAQARTRRYEYDAVGNLTRVEHRDGRVIKYFYDAWDRVKREEWYVSGDPNVRYVIATAYEEFGRTLSTTETSNGYTHGDFTSGLEWTYDNLDRTKTETNTRAITGSEQVRFEYVYNSAGDLATLREQNLSGAWRNATITTLGYDKLHRLTSVDVAADPFVWTNHSRHKKVAMAYNAAGELTTLDRNEWNGSTEVHFPLTTYTYDVWGRADLITTATISPYIVTAQYNPTWNRAGRVTNSESSGAQILALSEQWTYDYDFNGQLLRANEQFSTAADGAWQYDLAGTRRDNEPGSYHAYDVGPNNQQATSPDWVLQWDAEGRLDRRYRRINGAQSTLESAYAWDHRGRLLKVDQYDTSGLLAQSVHYAYDALDRRARQTVQIYIAGLPNPVTTLDERYVYENGELATVYDLLSTATTARDKLRERYLNARAVDLVLAQETLQGYSNVTGVQWYLHDHQGTPRDTLRRSSPSGGSTSIQHWQHIRYDAFGELVAVDAVTSGAPTTAPRIGYTGQVFDVTTGLNYYHARYYDANLGRFLSQDPAGFSTGDLNLYRYVGNDPVSLIDPTGMNPFRPNQWTDILSGPRNTIDVPASALYLGGPSASASLIDSYGALGRAPLLPSASDVAAAASFYEGGLVKSISSNETSGNNGALAILSGSFSNYGSEVLRTAKGYFWNAPKNTVVGAVQAVVHPVQTTQGLWAAVTHPKEAFNVIRADYEAKWATPEGKGEIGFEVATLLASFAKVGKAAQVADKAQDIQRIASTADDLARASQKLKLLNPEFVPDTQMVLQKIVNRVNSEVTANPGTLERILGRKRYAHIVADSPQADAFFGIGIEEGAANLISQDARLSSIFVRAMNRDPWTGRLRHGVDFFGIEERRIRPLDITTREGIDAHLRRRGYSQVDLVIQPGRKSSSF